MGYHITEITTAGGYLGRRMEAYGYLDEEDRTVILDPSLLGIDFTVIGIVYPTTVHSRRLLAVENGGRWFLAPVILESGNYIGSWRVAPEELVEAIEDAKLGWNIEKELYDDDEEIETEDT